MNRSMRFLRTALLLPVLAQLGGCFFVDWFTLPSKPKPVTAAQVPKHWNMAGRIGVIHGDEGWHGNLNWVQKDASFNASIAGPFGSKAAEFIGSGDVLQLRAPTGEMVDGEKLATWQEKNFGGPMPIKALPYWIHGLASPDIKGAIVKGKDGSVDEIAQGGWVIRYSRWTEFNKQYMPAKIDLSKAGVKMKLILDDYKVLN